MLIITFDKYDEIEAKADKRKISVNSRPMLLQNILNSSLTENLLEDILYSLRISKDEKYKKAINNYLKESIYFKDDDENIEEENLNKNEKDSFLQNLIMTFEEYDVLEYEIEKTNNIDLIDELSIEDLLTKSLTKDTLKEILIYYHITNKENDKKMINRFLKEHLVLVSEENIIEKDNESSFTPTEQNIKDMALVIERMDFKPSYYFPSIEELHENMNFKTEDEIAFLMWLSSADLELTNNEKKSMEYIQKILKEKMRIGN